MKTSEAIDQIVKAIAQARPSFRSIHKNQENPHFRQKYADLAAILDAVTLPLAEQGVIIAGGPEPLDDGGMLVTTRVLHASGQWLEASMKITAGKIQDLGSGITYARRYTTSALLALAADDDDDGEQAQAGQMPKPERVKVEVPYKALKTAELHEAILLQFKRLAPTQEAKTHVCQAVFGNAIDTWEKVKQLRDDDLRRGLGKLTARTPEDDDVPTHVPPDATGVPVVESSGEFHVSDTYGGREHVAAGEVDGKETHPRRMPLLRDASDGVRSPDSESHHATDRASRRDAGTPGQEDSPRAVLQGMQRTSERFVPGRAHGAQGRTQAAAAQEVRQDSPDATVGFIPDGGRGDGETAHGLHSSRTKAQSPDTVSPGMVVALPIEHETTETDLDDPGAGGDDFPAVEVDEDGMVLKAGVDLLEQWAKTHNNWLLLQRIRGEAPAWTLGQWKYAWVQVGPRNAKAPA